MISLFMVDLKFCSCWTHSSSWRLHMTREHVIDTNDRQMSVVKFRKLTKF